MQTGLAAGSILIDLKVCWTPMFESYASFKNFSISSFVLLVLRGLWVSTVPPLMISLSSVFSFADIWANFDVNLPNSCGTCEWDTTFHLQIALTVGIRTLRECCLFYTCSAVDRRHDMEAVFFQEYIVILPGISRPGFLKFYWQKLEVIDEIYWVNLAVSSRQSYFTQIFSVSARMFKETPLTVDSFESTSSATLPRVKPREKLDSGEASKPATTATLV